MNAPCDRPCCVSMRRLLGEALTERDELRGPAARTRELEDALRYVLSLNVLTIRDVERMSKLMKEKTNGI